MRRNRNNIGDPEEDLYSGYNEFPSALNTDDLEFDETFQNSARSIAEQRPVLMTSRGRQGTAMGSRLGTSAGFVREDMGTAGTGRSGLGTRGGTARPITGIGGESGGLNRPMTAVRGAGYMTTKNQRFDPLNQSLKISTPSIEIKTDDSPESKIKQIEEKISVIIEESVLANCKGKFQNALEHAKDAQQKERSLMKLREQASLLEGHDWDISFSVLFNLANQYEACEMYTEALSTYQSITKNKFLAHGAKVKINMGNIYLKQNLPTKAIKMYRMAMDQLASTNRSLRLKLMHNMGIVFLRINHAEDAAASFEYIMTEKPSFKTGLHLVVSNFMAGDPEKTKQSFKELLQVPVEIDDEEKYAPISDDPVSQLLVEVLKNDKLWKLEKERRTYAERCVLSAARLIAPVIENSFTEGYHWVTEAIKSSRHAPLAHALEISKALVFLKQRELGEAVEILKSFEKKETKVATAAATNLSFLFYLVRATEQGDLDQAEKYGEAAKVADFYNSSAMVNLGNCMAARGDLERAKQLYQEAVSMDSSSVEALYNLGLMSQKLRFYEEALDYFHKILVLVRNHSHVLYQLGRTHEFMGEIEVAMEWYLKALALSPTDAGILTKMASLYAADGNSRQAYQYYYDSYKCNPANVEVIDWIASYMLSDKNLPERAIIFYKHCNALQPTDPKWLLSIASCYRKMGNATITMEAYQKVFKQFPDNLEALRQLVRLTKETGHKDAKVYAEELKKLEMTATKRDVRSPERPAKGWQSKPQFRESLQTRSESPWSGNVKDGKGLRNLSSESGRSSGSGGKPGSNTLLLGTGVKAWGREGLDSGRTSSSGKLTVNRDSIGIGGGSSLSKLGSRDNSSVGGKSGSSLRPVSRLQGTPRTTEEESDDDVDDFFSKQVVSSNLLKF